eukprot:TRINITY_DN988_c0_g1_i18.p1 TRINITY_DN988_c0_g1~~TRINITY_DN988_c0_g1_i18.p1  ORF type:complete len:103 (-),score=21.51 TRINITY_DN988_c0_g1_i18:22-306(-)
MIRRPPRSTPLYSSAASDVYKRQDMDNTALIKHGIKSPIVHVAVRIIIGFTSSPSSVTSLLVALLRYTLNYLSLIHICRCRRIERCRSRWSPYH